MRQNRKVFIIAEAGVNHNGSVKTAKKMICAAKKAGADAVKFQTFKAERIASQFTPKTEYQKRTTDKGQLQLDMLRKLELDINAHRKLIDYCRKKEILFLSSPYDLEGVDLLNNLGLAIFKIPSAEITNLPYLKKIGALGRKVIISTGMSDLKEIEYALNVLTKAGTRKKDITILHCHTEYPTKIEDANLLAMLTIKNTFRIDVGYSDHTLGLTIPIAAATLGAKVIEKHFTLDRDMKGPDHKASLEPDELKEMVNAVRNIEKALGSGAKKPMPSERKNRLIMRKSIVARRDIAKGEIFTDENITSKRPATGLSPKVYYNLIGKRALHNIKADEILTRKMVEG